MEIIISSKTHGEKILFIDDEDFGFLEGRSAVLKKSRSTFYAKISMDSKEYYLHRLILNARKGVEIDHINRNGLDNRKSNLRVATHAQNTYNKFDKKNSKSGFKGVYWVKDKKLWCARITFNNKVIMGGYYKCKIDAAYAYNELANKYHKQFAYLNTFTDDDNRVRLNEPRYTKEKGRCKSGYRGVYQMGNRFVAHIRINKRKEHIGCYATKIEAAAAYNKKATEVYGENAILNNI